MGKPWLTMGCCAMGGKIKINKGQMGVTRRTYENLTLWFVKISRAPVFAEPVSAVYRGPKNFKTKEINGSSV
jgi:hypothetical protein